MANDRCSAKDGTPAPDAAIDAILRTPSTSSDWTTITSSYFSPQAITSRIEVAAGI
jgi:hypothetical protein